MEQRTPTMQIAAGGAGVDIQVIRDHITGKLSELSVDLGSRGGLYTGEILEIILSEQGALMEISEPIRRIADRHGISERSVRSLIRYTVINAWKNGDPEVQCRYFDRLVDFKRGKPTEACFILTLAMFLRRELCSYRAIPRTDPGIPPEMM